MILREIFSPAEILLCSYDVCSMELDIIGATVTQINMVCTLEKTICLCSTYWNKALNAMSSRYYLRKHSAL